MFDLKVGDVVYAVYCSDFGQGASLLMEQATVLGIGKTIRLSRSGLAFSCRSQFSREAYGTLFAKTPGEALTLWRAEQGRLAMEFAKRSQFYAERQQMHQYEFREPRR